MKYIDVRNMSHHFIDRDDEGNEISAKIAVDNVSLEVNSGDFIVVLGHNGSGKSTFAKHLNAILLPTAGKVYVDGIDTTDEARLWDIRQNTGMVFQNPDNQIIATIVEEDVGFGPENLGIETKEIWERVEKSLGAVNMLEYRKHSPNKLSGGQKQRVAIAGIVAMRPKCIVLDEPTAMLDPNGRKEVLDTIIELNKKENVTIILVTHFMEEVIHADKVFVMDDGCVAMSGTPKEIFSDVDKLKSLGLDVPDVTNLAYELNKAGLPVDKGILEINELCEAIVEAKRIGLNTTDSRTIGCNNSDCNNSDCNTLDCDIVDSEPEVNAGEKNKDIILEIDKLSHIYGKGTNYERVALNEVSFTIKKGEIIGIIGHTGSGKSTLIQHLNGLLKPENGNVLYKGMNIWEKGVKLSEIRCNIGLVFQYPEYQLFEATVLEDVCYGPKNMGLSKDEARTRAIKALELVGISEEMYERSPFELSGGEKRRVAIAGILAMEPEVLILDEPTAGLDPRRKKEILNLLQVLRKERNITIVIISHSMEDMATYADRIMVMNRGKIMYNDIPENVFVHYKELEKIGLAAPQIVYIMNSLKEKGMEIKRIPLTINDATQMIMAAK